MPAAAQASARTAGPSAFFGPWDRHNFVFHAVSALSRREPFRAAADQRVSPTYVPDLVNVCLDLLIDGESGIWHLANVGDVSWAELAARAATLARVSTETLQPCTSAVLGQVAARPRNGVLASERAALMPSLDDALQRFLDARFVADEAQAGGEHDAAILSPQRAAGA